MSPTKAVSLQFFNTVKLNRRLIVYSSFLQLNELRFRKNIPYEQRLH